MIGSIKALECQPYQHHNVLTFIILDSEVAYCQVAVDVVTKVEHLGSPPTRESQELVKVSLQWSSRHTTGHALYNLHSTVIYQKS